MYNPPKFLTVEVLSSVLAEYAWPDSYSLEDELPDGIAMVLPKCELFFTESFEGETNLVFPPGLTGLEFPVSLGEIVIALRAQGTLLDAPAPTPAGTYIPGASLKKVQDGIRDLCNLLQTYLRPTLEGDFSWADAVKRSRAEAEV